MKKILILLFIVLSIYSCKFSSSPLENSDSKSGMQEYVPGQVVAGLADTVSYKFAKSFFKSLNLEILDLDLGHCFWAIADSNDLEFYRKIFSNDSTVTFVNKLYSASTGDNLNITIGFTGVNSIESDLQKVKLAGLNVYKVLEHPKSVLLKTVIGQEKYWIEELAKYEFIRYAELNYISYIC